MHDVSKVSSGTEYKKIFYCIGIDFMLVLDLESSPKTLVIRNSANSAIDTTFNRLLSLDKESGTFNRLFLCFGTSAFKAEQSATASAVCPQSGIGIDGIDIRAHFGKY